MRWLLFIFWLAAPAMAETVVIASGEHDGYARLVVPLPAGAEWQLGRTAAGYELELAADDLRFDLSRVFDLIPKTRLTGVFVDPATGRLQLSLSCACHALPFQLDARTLVIDVRDAPAPPGSSFELALDGSRPAPLIAAAPQRPRARPKITVEMASNPLATYNWLSLPAADAKMVADLPPVTGPLRDRTANLQPLRDSLIQQLSRGAADGVIQLALPEGQPGAAIVVDDLQMRVTKLPGLAVQNERMAPQALQPDGVACLPDTTLDLTGWGGDGDTATKIATARAALVGEFDKPDQAAVAKAVQMQLHLGFGAEAELTIAAFDATDAGVPVWISLARIMDERPQDTDVFVQMAGCDTAAALWAVLAAPDAAPVDNVNVPAVQRAFSALPAHLRLHLAPRLAGRAVAMGEEELARAVTTATNRATAMPTGAQALLQARVDMAEGRVAEVATAMQDVLAAGGPSSAEALILLVDARVALAEPLAPEIPGVAAAMMREHAGTALEPALQHAWQLSMAAAGDFDGAFGAAPDASTLPAIWRLLARIGTDDALLAHGILPVGALVETDRAAAMLLAERLLGMGFSAAAAQWMGPLPIDARDADRLLQARVDLATGDGRAVLSTLAGQTTPEALVLKAQAEQMLGQPDLAHVTWAAAGDPAASVRAAGWAQSWNDVAQGAEGPWQVAAVTVSRPANADSAATGPLARGQALVKESAAARASLDALLATVPQP